MTESAIPSRVSATPPAIDLIERIRAQFGDFVFFQSGGCCEGSAPLALLRNEIAAGANDVKLGEIGGICFYMSRSQFAYWEHTHLIIDAVVGGGSNSLSLDGGTGWAFLTRSRLYTDEEWAVLSQQPVEAAA
ncbi:MAG TPA: DUF779 domain-containing protein [Rhodocyclaceae bacterium]